MAATTPLRDVWNGHPVALGIAWTLGKRDHVAQCVLFSNQFGWELRLEVGELFRTQVCRSPEEILDTQEAWNASMLEKGWSDSATGSPPILARSHLRARVDRTSAMLEAPVGDQEHGRTHGRPERNGRDDHPGVTATDMEEPRKLEQRS